MTLRLVLVALHIGVACGYAAVAGSAADITAVDDTVVTNEYTGLALHGWDPVAYFTRSEPTAGSERIEAVIKGVTWRFANEGNRAAFLKDHEVYWPQFGAHDPISIARGIPSAGHPLLWAIAEERLYLFHTDTNRTAFLRDPVAAHAAASRRWADVARRLAR